MGFNSAFCEYPLQAAVKGDEEQAAEAYDSLQTDPELGDLVTTHGPLYLDPSDDLFRRLVHSVVGQQVSVASASAIRRRLFDTVEVTPSGVLAADTQVLRDAGLSAMKAEYVTAVATVFDREGYCKESLATAPNEEIVDTLTAIRGVGPWTAEMQLLFTFGRPDVLPVGDLGVRRGIERLLGADLTRTEMRTRAEQWAPYRSYASLYLWRTVDGEE